MSRTKLRAYEVGGIKLAVEVPSQLPWSWPDGHAAHTCSPEAPDVYVSVRVGNPTVEVHDPIVYSAGDTTFEVGCHGRDWIIAVRSGRGPERVARFDAALGQGEIVVSPAVAAGRSFPLAAPVEELVFARCLLARGGLVLRASAAWQDRGAIAFLGEDRDEASPPADRRRARPSSVAHRRVVIRVADGRARAYAPPWDGGPAALEARSGRLEAIHSIVTAPAVFSKKVEDDEALDRILAHALAPAHASDGPDRVLEVAAELAACVPVLRFGLPRERGVLPLVWGQGPAAAAFSPPSPGAF